MNSCANHSQMSKSEDKRGKVTAEHIAEAERLSAIWAETYADRKTRNLHSQGAFGLEYGIGNQAAVGFFLNGKTALSLKAARGFAKGLQCSIADFSSRLAKEAELLAAAISTPSGPANDLVHRMATATPETLALIEIALLESDPAAVKKLTPSLVNLVRAVKETIKAQQGATGSEQMDLPDPG